MLIFDNGIIKAYARIFPENRKRTRLEREQTEESLLAEAFPGHKNIAIGHRADGAPLLLNTPFPAAISISHSNRVVALAIADNSKATFHGIGIDTETFDRGSQ